ncbi:hypothetical protein ONS96_004464 [Cadophora gregata f. sp. sojae]|nr:hypothetical protein ONS96_004464 [Cadophora gregata f. sp. sojae]
MDNIFVSLDALLYTLGISILLVIAYALNSRNAQSNYKKETIKPKSGTGDTVQHAKALEIYEDLRQSPSWWSDEKLFEVEKRAIFSKTWLFVTHASRFQKPGDYRTFDIAGFSFIVILGKDKEIRAFHNVCRHRAYAVTKKESGSSTVLGCRYHGWSYDTRGKLVKAPEFDKVPGFDKETNGLWEIKTSIVLSMVYVNFDASTHVDSFDLHGSEVLLRKWSVSKMKCLEEWKTEGAFNWKLLGMCIAGHKCSDLISPFRYTIAARGKEAEALVRNSSWFGSWKPGRPRTRAYNNYAKNWAQHHLDTESSAKVCQEHNVRMQYLCQRSSDHDRYGFTEE